MYSQYAANKILDATDRGIAFSVAASYVGLFLAMPGLDDTGGTEVSGVSYARQAISFGAAATRANASSAVETFPAAGAGGWGTVIGVGRWDALTSGNLIESAMLSTGSSSLSADITSVATTLTVADGTKFTNGGTILLDQEQMTITGIATNVLTITRHVNGTTAASHSAGAQVYALTRKQIDAGDVFYVPSGQFTHYLA